MHSQMAVDRRISIAQFVHRRPLAATSRAAREAARAAVLSIALDDVVTQFGSRLRAIGVRYQLDPVELDDLVQETRLRLWRAVGDGDRIRALAASYVYRTAASSAVDLIRRRPFKRSIPIDAPGGPQHVALGASAHDELELAELTAHVHAIIAAIPASRREVVRLHFAGHSVSEIAAVFGWNETRVRNLVFRGVAEVRARLRDAGIHPPSKVRESRAS